LNPEVRDRICRTVCANFGFGALALDARRLLQYNVSRSPTDARIMPTHVHSQHHHHHHHPGRGHPPASVSPSILRMSVVERLAIAAALIVLLWGAVLWAMKV
jgi:hypothetical protein